VSWSATAGKRQELGGVRNTNNRRRFNQVQFPRPDAKATTPRWSHPPYDQPGMLRTFAASASWREIFRSLVALGELCGLCDVVVKIKAAL
jgi:hypothetical protein